MSPEDAWDLVRANSIYMQVVAFQKTSVEISRDNNKNRPSSVKANRGKRSSNGH